jgi:succinyl-diaminopimelate desuccinylase
MVSASSPPPGTATLADAFVALERAAETAVEDLRRMVAVDTSFPPGRGYDAFADLMEQFAAPLALCCERIVVPEHLWRAPGADGTRTNLIARSRSGKPVLGLYFHVDTVPPAPGWRTDPFALSRSGDELIGLGAADMKGSIAAALLALRAADLAGFAPTRKRGSIPACVTSPSRDVSKVTS